MMTSIENWNKFYCIISNVHRCKKQKAAKKIAWLWYSLLHVLLFEFPNVFDNFAIKWWTKTTKSIAMTLTFVVNAEKISFKSRSIEHTAYINTMYKHQWLNYGSLIRCRIECSLPPSWNSTKWTTAQKRHRRWIMNKFKQMKKKLKWNQAAIVFKILNNNVEGNQKILWNNYLHTYLWSMISGQPSIHELGKDKESEYWIPLPKVFMLHFEIIFSMCVFITLVIDANVQRAYNFFVFRFATNSTFFDFRCGFQWIKVFTVSVDKFFFFILFEFRAK